MSTWKEAWSPFPEARLVVRRESRKNFRSKAGFLASGPSFSDLPMRFSNKNLKLRFRSLKELHSGLEKNLPVTVAGPHQLLTDFPNTLHRWKHFKSLGMRVSTLFQKPFQTGSFTGREPVSLTFEINFFESRVFHFQLGYRSEKISDELPKFLQAKNIWKCLFRWDFFLFFGKIFLT